MTVRKRGKLTKDCFILPSSSPSLFLSKSTLPSLLSISNKLLPPSRSLFPLLPSIYLYAIPALSLQLSLSLSRSLSLNSSFPSPLPPKKPRSHFYRMITSSDQRLGRNSADEIKAHPFFAGVDWNTIRNIESPFIPQLRFVIYLPFPLSFLPARPTDRESLNVVHRSLTDTSYFPTEDLGDVPEQPQGSESTSGSKDLAFLGYTVRLILLSIFLS